MTVTDHEYLKKILLAPVYDVAVNSDLVLLSRLTAELGNDVFLKREDQQSVFSYKIRGAYNLMASLSKEDQELGVIAASAGNHAQGVALAAKHLHLKSTIVMPKTTPEIKIDSVKRMDAEVILHGNTYDDAKDHALKLSSKTGMYYVSPYDHPLVISGQATVGVELLKQHPNKPDIIFVPVGGGGLVAGIAAYVKKIHPDIKIIGVEPDEAPCMHDAIKAGKLIELEHIGIFADGAAVKQAGEECYRITKELVDEILLVSVDEICAAVKDIFEDTRSIPEPAGALALAGLKQYVSSHGVKNKELVSIFSGANVNFDRLRHIAELSALGENREALISIMIPERPGSFQKLCHDLGPRLITEFNYRKSNAVNASVFAGVKIKDRESERSTLINNLMSKGYDPIDMTDDEVAKMHLRFMVGGPSSEDVKNERLLRFEFPERAGALMLFLSNLGSRWNISLFHYRNHGADIGRVLVGMQVPEKDQEIFTSFLKKLEYPYYDESDNLGYKLFLGKNS